jgi:hypothetical protein
MGALTRPRNLRVQRVHSLRGIEGCRGSRHRTTSECDKHCADFTELNIYSLEAAISSLRSLERVTRSSAKRR